MTNSPAPASYAKLLFEITAMWVDDLERILTSAGHTFEIAVCDNESDRYDSLVRVETTADEQQIRDAMATAVERRGTDLCSAVRVRRGHGGPSPEWIAGIDPGELDDDAAKKLSTIAASHSLFQFCHMVSAALAGEAWAAVRVDTVIDLVFASDLEPGDNTAKLALRVIRITDTSRPDGAIARRLVP